MASASSEIGRNRPLRRKRWYVLDRSLRAISIFGSFQNDRKTDEFGELFGSSRGPTFAGDVANDIDSSGVAWQHLRRCSLEKRERMRMLYSDNRALYRPS
ncbi:hypothetical protein QMZ05_37095 [Bradyrhizobium sp. INPA03-11B]|uniref:hypothetical protein n=1 Tax=Bradyrhizobium sp. INPA03-11B TaxID=418598 RepID=UPI00338DE23D